MPRIGLSNLHIAELLKDDANGVEYDNPIKVVALAKAKASPKTNSKTYYADNIPMETYTAMGEGELEIEVGDFPIDILGKMLGSKVVNGVMYSKSTDAANAPYFAVGFEGLKSNGKRVFYWYYKVRFAIPEEDLKTMEDTPEYQPETVKAIFVNRAFDGKWRAKADEDAKDFEPATATNWFTEVHEEVPAV